MGAYIGDTLLDKIMFFGAIAVFGLMIFSAVSNKKNSK